MAQIIRRPGYGPITIVKSWVKADGAHIGEMEGGGYVHLSGLPVQSLDELNGMVMTDGDWQRAVDYFDEEKRRVVEVDKQITMKPDGSYEWSDGTPITTYNEIIHATSPGKGQDAVLDWFAQSRAAAAKRDKLAESPLGQAAADVAGDKKTAPQKSTEKGAKRTAPKKGKTTPAPKPAPAASAPAPATAGLDQVTT